MENDEIFIVEEDRPAYDLEDRLIGFSVVTLNLISKLPNHYASNHLGMQLTRSCTSSALNYGEAQAAESRQDFLHKIKIVLKEIRESRVNLKIIQKMGYVPSASVEPVLQECNELMAIFMKSVQTVKEKMNQRK